MTTLRNRIVRLHERRPTLGDHLTEAVRRRVAFEKLAKALPETPSTATYYIQSSMSPVDDEDTARINDCAVQVESILEESLTRAGYSVSFARQGSVTNNTHIHDYSDIDVLVINEDFVSLEDPLTPSNPYKGNPIKELSAMRAACQETLSSEIPSVSVNDTGAKALSISGPSLYSKVDIVPANWLDTEKYQSTKNIIFRGVKILDKETGKRLKNFPFLHNKKLDLRDKETEGQLRRLIRVVKSIRSDSDNIIKASSYDICSLCYHMDDNLWIKNDDVKLLLNFCEYSVALLQNKGKRERLLVPNEQRQIFCEEGLQPEALSSLASEIIKIIQICHNRH